MRISFACDITTSWNRSRNSSIASVSPRRTAATSAASLASRNRVSTPPPHAGSASRRPQRRRRRRRYVAHTLSPRSRCTLVTSAVASRRVRILGDAQRHGVGEVTCDEPPEQLRKPRGGTPVESRVEKALVPAVCARRANSVAAGGAQHHEQIGPGVGDTLKVCVEWLCRASLARAIGFFHFLETRTKSRRREAEVGQRPPDR